MTDPVTRFWADHPDGGIFADIIGTTGLDGAPATGYSVLAQVFKNRHDGIPATTGLAYETTVEKAETVATERALAKLGYVDG